MSESSETEMRNQLLLCKEENTILLFVNPDGNMSFFRRLGNEKHRPQLIQFAELVEANLGFRRTPLTKKHLLIEPCHERVRVFGRLSGTGLKQMENEI
jgi:hypothetical protein